jgi:hypothetical protein
MIGKIRVTPRRSWGFVFAAVALLGGRAAWAQAPDKGTSEKAPAAEGDKPTVVAQAEAAPPPPPAPPPPAPAPAAPPVAAVPPPDTAGTVTAEPAKPAPDFKKINVGVASRVGGAFSDSAGGTGLNNASLDEIYVEPRFSGDIAPMFAWQANFQGGIPTGAPGGVSTAGGSGSGIGGFSASILDLIAKFEPHAAFHLWAGRLLVASDRSNFSGPWFMSPWKYPGLYPGLPFPVGPKQGPQGRNNGVTAWGEFVGGKVKYYAGMFDMNDAAVSPLFTGRVNICLLGSESGFYHSSTYYGSQDILAIGLGAQYQKNGQRNATGVPLGDLSSVFTDVLFEKNLGPGGVVSAEGQYYLFSDNDFHQRKHAYYGLLSWLTPSKIGFGKIQPLVRLQQARPNSAAEMMGGSVGSTWTMIDGYVTYVIDDYFLRVAGGFQHARMGGDLNSNAAFLGVQMQR